MKENEDNKNHVTYHHPEKGITTIFLKYFAYA